ncbi:tetratricopeptide repeat protein [Fodinicurvata sediminis]|uniref:tetratricopeptide repeat protein n=1 Tax=Fodinicurvata sediminis TaxID=1121832 RepID=UPI0003B3813F|nr:tetratricopeptide repeat protein [Fodinicurvata sediminis]
MTCLDSRNLSLATNSDLAAERYRQGVDLLLSAWPGAAERLDQALAADPDFALAHAARARLHAIRGELPHARKRIEAAEALVARQGHAREQSHVDILSLVIQGRSAEALKQICTHLDSWPRDILIFSLPLGAFGLFAFSGMAAHDQARVDLCERHARHFEADDWWFLTYRGWAHTENGNLVLGRDLTQRGLELRIENANAAHALAHALYEAGEIEETEAVISQWLPGYDCSGTLHGHIAWHAALAALERGDVERALTIYTESIRPEVSLGLPINVVSDTASFLWRLQAYGHAVPDGLWEEAAAYSEDYFQKPGLAFIDVHMAILAAATGDSSALERRVEALKHLDESGALGAGPVAPALCQAVQAFAEEQYRNCIGILEPVADEVVRIGGSGAQREMVEDMRLLAFMQGGEAIKARDLLDRRLHRRPSPRDLRWREAVTR